MHKLWNDGGLRLVAVTLAAIAAVAIVINRMSSLLDQWAPNIATEAISVLVTIIVVDRIIDNRERLRMKPRVERALRDVGGDFRMLVRGIAWDYRATHAATFEPIPTTSLGVLDHWLANVGREDSERAVHGDNDLPAAVTHALQVATSLQRVRDNDKDVLEPEVVAAIDEFEEDARLALAVYHGMPGASVGDRAREAIGLIVQATHNLGETLIRQDRQWLDEGAVLFARSGSWGTDLEAAKSPSS
ncbi:MAG: hypothetical protein QOH16_3882 [Gaiellaceae bacterium]|nr:hypothetical protein [Gaiellaceae bacterium]